jgi:DNA-binding MarR family transcriptional regulator
MTQLSPLFTWRSAVASSDLPMAVKCVAFALSLHMNERGGSCFPAVKTLAKEASCGTRTVQRSVRALVRDGWLAMEAGGGNRSNIYHALTPATVAPLPQEHPRHTDGGGVPETTHTPATVAYEDVKESVIEDVKTVYDQWRQARGKTNGRYATISPKRRQKIQARLREFSVADLIRAINAVAFDPWSERDQHDDITVLFKSREAVERWLEMYDNPPRPKARRDGGVTAAEVWAQVMAEDEPPTVIEHREGLNP